MDSSMCDEGFGMFFASIESAFADVLSIIVQQCGEARECVVDVLGNPREAVPSRVFYQAREMQFWADKLYSYAVAIERRGALHS